MQRCTAVLLVEGRMNNLNISAKQWLVIKRAIARIYSKCRDEIEAMTQEYVDSLTEAEKERVGIVYEKRFVLLREECAKRAANSNDLTYRYLNDLTPLIFGEAANIEAWRLDLRHVAVAIELINEDAVRRLILDDPDILPPLKHDLAADLRWNRKKITNVVTRAIIKGDSMDALAKTLSTEISDMNHKQGMRVARTAVTNAHNGGRQHTFERAQSMGIEVRKRWLATKDSRTREWHGNLDGVTIGIDELFETDIGSKLAYPCDVSHEAKAGDIYNCRCRVQYVDKIEPESREVAVRNPVTGKWEYKKDMTYKDWLRWKNGG